MAQTIRNGRARWAVSKTKTISRMEFKIRLEARRSKGEGPEEALDPEIFEDWADAADFLKYFTTAHVDNVKTTHLAGTRKRAKPDCSDWSN